MPKSLLNPSRAFRAKAVALIFGILFALAISFLVYSQHGNIAENLTNSTENLTKWTEIYQITLESYLKQDTALNENIDFIAIDLAALEFANDYDKKAIAAWIGREYVPVIDANMDGLRAKDLFDEKGMYIPDGVFLSINEVAETDSEIIIKGMKYRGARAANWFETKWQLNNGIWQFAETIMTMIS